MASAAAAGAAESGTESGAERPAAPAAPAAPLPVCPPPAPGHYERALAAHVARHSAVKQRTEAWFAAKRFVIGGSELSVVLGCNPYQSWEALVAKKLGLQSGRPPGVACWWGTMFEPVSERLVEIDCGVTMSGTDIHIRAPGFPEHANSPDGYCVLYLTDEPAEEESDSAEGESASAEEESDSAEGESAPAEGESAPAEAPDDRFIRICHDPKAARARGAHIWPVPVLVELKAPYSRIPDGRIPKHYLPQVLSGIALSPVAAGLYVDIVYRICTLDQLGFSAGYSSYHRGDERRGKGKPLWEAAYAWGATAVYAPATGTRRFRADAGRADEDCLRIRATHLGYDPQTCCETAGEELLDLGEVADASPRDFDKLMYYIDNKELLIAHTDPWREQDEDGFARFVRVTRTVSLPNYYLLGYLPWKVMQADFHLAEPQLGFIDQIRAPVQELIRDVHSLLREDNVAAAYCRYCEKRRAAKPGRGTSTASVTEAEKDSLFDGL